MRKKTPREFSREFKLGVMRRLESGEAVRSLAGELRIASNQLYVWWAAFRARGPDGLRPRGRPPKLSSEGEPPGEGAASGAPASELEWAQRRVAELERKVGQQQLELDFFRRALRQVEALSRPKGGRGATASTPSSKR